MVVTCNDADLCAYLTDILGTRFAGEFDIKYYVAAMHNWMNGDGGGEPWIQSQFDYLKTGADHITVEVNRTGETIGTPGSGETVFGDMSILKADANTLLAGQTYGSGLTSQVQAMLGYPTDGSFTVRQDFINTRTAFSIVDALNALVQARWGGGSTTWGNALENIAAYFLDKTGVLKPVAQNDAQKASGVTPPISALTLDAYSAVTTQHVYSIAQGYYGMRLQLTVPSSWGRLATWPYTFTPPPARLYFMDRGHAQPAPQDIYTDFVTIYPFPSWADSYVLSFPTGVSCDQAGWGLTH